MALDLDSEPNGHGLSGRDKLEKILATEPNITIFLKPIAPPAALGLAGFASSTWITASYIAGWWGSPDSPTVFFPFVAFFGGLAQFIAGIYGFQARDVLVTVLNTMWGAFWLSVGLLYFLVSNGNVPAHSIHTHFPELAAWFVPLAVITWSCVISASARDVVLLGVVASLAIGTTIACSLFSYNKGPNVGITVAAYFWMLSALLAWYRVTVYLVEEAYGKDHIVTKFFPIGRMPHEKKQPLVIPGLGEPGVKRGVPKPL